MLKNGDWFRDLLVLTLLLGSFFGFKLGERALWSPDEGKCLSPGITSRRA